MTSAYTPYDASPTPTATRSIPFSGSDRIRSALIRVVFDQAPAQAPGLDAHERIRLRIEIRGAAEDFDTDRVALQPVAVTGQRLLDDEAQKMRGAAGLLKTPTRENALELGANVGRTRLR